MAGGGDPFYLKFGPTGPRWSKIADFEPIFARSASAVTSKNDWCGRPLLRENLADTDSPADFLSTFNSKVQLTLIESSLRAFQ